MKQLLAGIVIGVAATSIAHAVFQVATRHSGFP